MTATMPWRISLLYRYLYVHLLISNVEEENEPRSAASSGFGDDLGSLNFEMGCESSRVLSDVQSSSESSGSSLWDKDQEGR
jgi:hypothetical protein